MPDDRKYVRVYFTVIDDDRFKLVYRNEAAFGTWVKLLLTADAVWPASCDLPRWVKPAPLRLLVDAGIVDLFPDHRYRIHGLDEERNRRGAAAAVGGRASGRSRSVEQTPNDRSNTVPDQTNLAKTSRDEQSQDEQDARAGWDEPEHEALVWLARHGCDIRPGNGYHQKLVVAVEHHGVNAIVGMFDRLADAGTKPGDVKGFLFGAIDALDKRSRPNLSVLEAEDRADEDAAARQRRIEKTRAETAALREALDKSSPEHTA